MLRKTLLSFALVAGLCATAHAGPFLSRPTPPSAAQLGLNAEQSATWQMIQADAQSLRMSTLSAVKAEFRESKLTLADSDADLRSLGLDYQAIALTALMEQRQLRDRRLAFYYSLNPQQQAQVREFMIVMIERAERFIRAVEVLQSE